MNGQTFSGLRGSAGGPTGRSLPAEEGIGHVLEVLAHLLARAVRVAVAQRLDDRGVLPVLAAA
ncbi:hypothetical protein GCM10027360_87440 [Amycolatopsis echigonensis]